jgi:hypothetical protein
LEGGETFGNWEIRSRAKILWKLSHCSMKGVTFFCLFCFLIGHQKKEEDEETKEQGGKRSML